MRRIISLATLLLVAVVSGATERAPDCQIQGTVKSARDGAPIAGAEIVVEQVRRTTTTGADGSYCVKGLDPGVYHLLITADGFKAEHSTPIRVNGTTSTVDVVLQTAFRSETVVTATRTAKRLDEVPVRTEVITSEQIEKTEARTLADAVEFTTGVRVENNCQNCNFSQIRLLGLDGAYTQILMDGQPMVSSLAQVYGVEHIPARMIERIEVVKGGGSAVYGSGAVGGVVNIIPREPTRSGGEVSFLGEQWDGESGNSFDASMDWVSPNKETSFSIFGQVTRSRPSTSIMTASPKSASVISRRSESVGPTTPSTATRA